MQSVFLYGNSNMWPITKRYILDRLKILNYPNVIVCLYEPMILFNDNEYPGKILNYIAISTPQTLQETGSDKDNWGETKYDNIIEHLNLNVLKMRIDVVNNIKLLSYNFIDKGYLWDLNLNTRIELFYNLFSDQVQEFSYFNSNNIKTNENSNIFFVPSIVNISEDNKGRSIFSSEERLNQTLKQLQSIRDKGYTSVLLETSNLNLYQISQLLQFTDKICLFYSDLEIYNLAYKDTNKNKTEIQLLRKILPHFVDKPFQRFFKFGSRYHLTRDFNIDSFSTEYISGKLISKYLNVYKFDILEPVLYSVPRLLINDFIKVCKDIFDGLELKLKIIDGKYMFALQHDIDNGDYVKIQRDIEYTLPLILQENNFKIHQVDILHVYGAGAVRGNYRYI